MKVRTVPHGRIRQKYNAEPTAREKAYHRWLIDNELCCCDCGKAATVAHHPLTRHPLQRWRRDHEYVVPMNWSCHMDLHATGDEEVWRPDLALPEIAHWHRGEAAAAGILEEL